jgi:hypothetical protein
MSNSSSGSSSSRRIRSNPYSIHMKRLPTYKGPAYTVQRLSFAPYPLQAACSPHLDAVVCWPLCCRLVLWMGCLCCFCGYTGLYLMASGKAPNNFAQLLIFAIAAGG